MKSAQYRIEDLVSITGLTFCQIRRYIREAHLPGAVKAGRYSTYPAATLAGIQQVQQLFADNMTMRDIHDRLHPEDDDGDGPFEYDDDGSLG